MRPQHVGDNRIAVRELEPDPASRLEAVRHRLDADVEAVDLSGLDGLRIGVGVIGLHFYALGRIERPMRSA